MPMENSERYWRATARSLTRRINLGWWLEVWTGWLLAVAIMAAVTVLLTRWGNWFNLSHIWYGVGAALAVGAGFAWWFAKRRFESSQTSLIRLEDSLRMKTRLTSAAAGVGTWPEPPSALVWPVQWRWQKPVTVMAFAIVMLALAVNIPISRQVTDEQRTIEKPSAVKDVEQWMTEVRKEDAVHEESIKEVEDKISEMLKRPAENWYEHGNLEAAQNLKEQTAAMMRQLSQNLEDAERAANNLQAAGSTLPGATKDALTKQLLDAAKDLTTGGLKPDEKLLEQLKKMSGGQMPQLNKEQMQNLQEMLKQNSEALKEALKNMPSFGPGEGEGEEGKDGDKPGQGDITRGPGAAPMSLKNKETNLNTDKLETLDSNLDYERIAPGDLMGTTDGKHEVDENAPLSSQQGGTIDHEADGGSAVWQNSLLPEERESLKRYFK